MQPSTTIFLLFVNVGALFIYHLVVHHINVIDDNVKLSQRNHELAMQNLQYMNLQDKITEARRAKHDIRHHISIMRSYIQEHEYDKLEIYLNHYQRSLPDDSTIVFCKNHAINVLLLYFAQQARDNNIDFEVHASLPENLEVSDNDLSVLLGNLIENAVDACIAQQDINKKISIKIRYNGSNLFFMVDNTYEGSVIQNRHGQYISTKNNGSGLGLISVKNIVDRYEGSITINHDHQMFCVSIMLNVPYSAGK